MHRPAATHRGVAPSGGALFAIVLLVVAVLYLGRTVFIPLSLAILLSFLLAPAVLHLRHWGLGRAPAVFSVVLLAFGLLVIIGMLMTSQLSDLGHKLPQYQQNVNHKFETLRASGGGWLNRATVWIRNLSDEFTPSQPAPANSPGRPRPVPVEIRPSPFSPLAAVGSILGSLLSILLTACIVIVFVIFMLFEHEDLRDRLIRLGGAGRLHLTTSLLADTGRRVSRYLLAQLIVNVTYGVLVGTGLYLMRVPNPLLWGLMAALLRYIPYLGIWIAAAMPAAVAFAVEAGWIKVPLVFGMYFGLDLVMYNFVEPLLYGSSTGLSPLAILVAAVFWTWLWGPLGLLLATPLTVCVVVLGGHVPRLDFLQVLLTAEPVLPPQTRFYQRLLAEDIDEATEIAEQFLKDKPLAELYDTVLIPALSLAEEDRHRGKLDAGHEEFIFRNTRALIQDLASRSGHSVPEQTSTEAKVLCVPARDEADELASIMLAQLLAAQGIAAQVSSSLALVGEALEQISREQLKVVCVLAVPPFGYVHARYFCRRVETQSPETKVIAAILTEANVMEVKARQPALSAIEVATSLRTVLTQIPSLLPVRAAAVSNSTADQLSAQKPTPQEKV
ncbi:MAG TPA: AI-2E family transporter [Verrucomicrobiae bacterium]|nr:AI-2E family transporter [Verrucomicrobiae bacterium]